MAYTNTVIVSDSEDVTDVISISSDSDDTRITEIEDITLNELELEVPLCSYHIVELSSKQEQNVNDTSSPVRKRGKEKDENQSRRGNRTRTPHVSSSDSSSEDDTPTQRNDVTSTRETEHPSSRQLTQLRSAKPTSPVVSEIQRQDSQLKSKTQSKINPGSSRSFKSARRRLNSDAESSQITNAEESDETVNSDEECGHVAVEDTKNLEEDTICASTLYSDVEPSLFEDESDRYVEEHIDDVVKKAESRRSITERKEDTERSVVDLEKSTSDEESRYDFEENVNYLDTLKPKLRNFVRNVESKSTDESVDDRDDPTDGVSNGKIRNNNNNKKTPSKTEKQIKKGVRTDEKKNNQPKKSGNSRRPIRVGKSSERRGKTNKNQAPRQSFPHSIKSHNSQDILSTPVKFDFEDDLPSLRSIGRRADSKTNKDTPSSKQESALIAKVSIPQRRGCSRGKVISQGPARRQRRVYSGSRVTAPEIRRLARRGGVYRISKDITNHANDVLRDFLEDVIRKSVIYCEYEKRKTITVQDVICALKSRGHVLYGAFEK